MSFLRGPMHVDDQTVELALLILRTDCNEFLHHRRQMV